MNRHLLITLAAGALLSVPATMRAQKANVPVETGAFSPNWESLSAWECPQWFKDAKFGIWAHWGPQCEAEDGDWYGRNMYLLNTDQYNYHVAHYGDPSVFGLKDLCNAWKADQWNPDELVKLYKSVGARYFMALGQHHDNFDLWNSPYQEWNSVNIGPKKDIAKGWSDACKKYGLKMGISMHGSHTWTWLEPAQDFDGNLTKEDGYTLNADGTEKWWKGLDPQELYAQRHTRSASQNTGDIWDWGNGASLPSDEFKTKFQNRVLEYINDYNPDMIYFDDTVLPFWGCDEQVGLNILADYYNHSAKQNNGTPQVVVTGKQLPATQKKAMMWDVERGIPNDIQSDYWQTCTCIGNWHYDRNLYNNNGYKSAQQVVDMLVDIVSKNGNLLLSVPIRGKGTIDEKEQAVLAGIKKWMDVNSRSIYATHPWKTFGEGPQADNAAGLSAQGFNEANNYTSDDVRYTQKGDTLFATIMRWPSIDKFTFAQLGKASANYPGEVKSVELLGYDGQISVGSDIDGVTVDVPDNTNDMIAPVYAFTFDASTAGQTSLEEIIALYESKIEELKATASYNTGKLNLSSLESFEQTVDSAKADIGSSEAQQLTTLSRLRKAYAHLLANGINQASTASTGYEQDATTDQLVESTNFTASTIGSRFGTPQYWTVENDSIPQTDDSKGVKNGIDNSPGQNTLMLGTWKGEDGPTTSDISNARIYRKVHLQAGRWFFGAGIQHAYNLSDRAYIFASTTTLSTSDIPSKSIAYWPINKCATNGTPVGLYFTLDEPQDVILGFQANLLQGNNSQEFRINQVQLLYYGMVDFGTLDALITQVEDEAVYNVRINSNTGFYSQEAADKLQVALNEAEQVTEDASMDDIKTAYNKLNEAYQDFKENGKNPGGVPNMTGATDISQQTFGETDHFSRADASVTTRFASPRDWTVENFKIPNGDNGVKNGLDKNSGYDCIYLGLWDDRQNNEDGDIANARIYRSVHLKAGRYFFGAAYENNWNMTDQAYLFAAEQTMPTASIPESSIAYYPINRGSADGNTYGIYFNLEQDQDVLLGWQADLSSGASEQEIRAKSVSLLYYGEMTYEKVRTLISSIVDSLPALQVNDNTGYYSKSAYATLEAAVNTARELKSSADYEAISTAYSKLSEAWANFLKNGRNAGGVPDEAATTDLTTEKLVEASQFSRADNSTTRYGSPLYWTVENYEIPTTSDGTRAGLDRYPGFNCLTLGIWDDRDNATSDMHNARFYRRVSLPQGRYFFGGSFNALYNLQQGYVYAATENLPTEDIETQSIAWYNLNNGAINNNVYGIFFTLDAPQDVILGYQANLADGPSAQEFRISQVKLLSYDLYTGISEVKADEPSESCRYDGRIYSIDGRYLGTDVSCLGHGLYIRNGKKIIK